MRSSRLSLIAVMTAVALCVATAIWAAAGPFTSKDHFPAAQPSCAAPDLAGTVVDVTLTDGGPMQPSVTGPATTRRGVVAPGATWPTADGSSDRVARRSGYPYPGMGMGTMRILVNPATVPDRTALAQRLHRIVQLPGPRRMPQHQQLLVTDPSPDSHQRLETHLQPPPPPLGPGLPTSGPLRCRMYPPMNDSHRWCPVHGVRPIQSMASRSGYASPYRCDVGPA